MSKANKKNKSAEESSKLFHDIMKASVKGNHKQEKKPETDFSKPMAILKHIQAEVEMDVPDWSEFSWIQISMRPPYSILYFIDEDCPTDKYSKIQKKITEQAQIMEIEAEFHD